MTRYRGINEKCVKEDSHCKMTNRNSLASFRNFLTWNRPNVECFKSTRYFLVRPIVGVLFCVWMWPVVQSLHLDKNHRCSHALQKNSGVLKSPNYPNSYPNNIDCDWLIQVEVGEQVQLRFNAFSFEEQPNTDYVKVFDGGNQTDALLGEYYGYSGMHAIVESSSNRMYVVMHSNAHNVENGFSATFQQKGFCLRDQYTCGWGEKDCYMISEKCDGVWHCRHEGGDERGCGGCDQTLFSCDDRKQCYTRGDRCDGIGRCHNSGDEMFCSADMCNLNNGTFLCKNKKCIYEKWLCDAANDCGDNSDEVNCSVMPRRVILMFVIAILLCGLLIVVAVGCICRLRLLRSFHRQHQWRHLDETLSPTPPPPYSESLMTSHTVEEAEQEVLDELQAIAARRQDRMNGVVNDQTENQVGGDEQLIDVASGGDVDSSSGVHIAMAVGETPTVFWRQESVADQTAQLLTDDDESYDVDKATSGGSEISDETTSVASGDILSSRHCMKKLSAAAS
ncbi:Low-density lipoprotein receptor-related protein 12 [Lamellibrachia satsuma]|nr:Low-density lipoprotein receptor-related protein 12 [Lamellibrachia satsuma]